MIFRGCKSRNIGNRRIVNELLQREACGRESTKEERGPKKPNGRESNWSAHENQANSRKVIKRGPTKTSRPFQRDHGKIRRAEIEEKNRV